MRDWTKSALWATISIPISMLGIWIEFGLVHSSFFFLIPFLPGIGALYLFGPEGWFPISDSTLGFLIIGCTAQYLGYFAVIHILRALFRRLRKN